MLWESCHNQDGKMLYHIIIIIMDIMISDVSITCIQLSVN